LKHLRLSCVGGDSGDLQGDLLGRKIGTIRYGVDPDTPFLDERDPDIVLIEGPSDATGMIKEFTMPGVTPPVALLCYTANVPVHSIVYPFAVYSSEYRAMLWAAEHGRPCRFIDLPSDIKAPLYLVISQKSSFLQEIPAGVLYYNKKQPGDDFLWT